VGPARTNFALWTGVKLALAAVAIFLLVRIAIPDLVNAHNTPLLLLAVACGLLALAIAIWTGLSIWRAWRRLRASRTNLIEVKR